MQKLPQVHVNTSPSCSEGCFYPTCAGLSFERLSVDISKDSLSKDSLSKDVPAQFGPIIELLDAIPDGTLSSKQVVPPQ